MGFGKVFKSALKRTVLAGRAVKAREKKKRKAPWGPSPEETAETNRAKAARRFIQRPMTRQAGAGQVSYIGEFEEKEWD